MIRLLIAGLNSLVLGLSLMVIHYILALTSPANPEIINQITQKGGIVAVIGSIILVIGLVRGLRRNLSPETAAILTTGSAVIVIGISTIIRVHGYGNEEYVSAGAWVATGIGVTLVIIYAILRYRQIRNQ